MTNIGSNQGQGDTLQEQRTNGIHSPNKDESAIESMQDFGIPDEIVGRQSDKYIAQDSAYSMRHEDS